MSELREAINELTIEGILKEKNLESVVVDKKDVIRGDLIVITGKNNEHKIRIYVTKQTQKGTENPAYKGMLTVKDTYVSKAEALQNGGTPDVVRMSCKLTLNEYYGENGELVSYLTPSTSFVNRVTDREMKEDASGTIEIFLTKIKPEFVKGEETGRSVIEGWTTGYGGRVFPVSFKANSDIATYMDTNFEMNKNTILNYELINNVITEIQQLGGGFGKAREKVITSSVHEILIVGGEPDQYDEETDAPVKVKNGQAMVAIQGFQKDLLKAGMTQREIYLTELKEKAQNKKPATTSGTSTKKQVDTSEDFSF